MGKWLPKRTAEVSQHLAGKRNGISTTLTLNSVTTLKKENLNKKLNKTITITEEHKIVKDEKDIKIVKIEAEAEVLLKKEQIFKGLQNEMRKMISAKNILHQRNQEINTATRKRGINLGNSIALQNNKKTKQLLIWL